MQNCLKITTHLRNETMTMGYNLWSFDTSIFLLISNLFISCIRNTVLFREKKFISDISSSFLFSKISTWAPFSSAFLFKAFPLIKNLISLFYSAFFGKNTNLISNSLIKSCIPCQFSLTYCNSLIISCFLESISFCTLSLFCSSRWRQYLSRAALKDLVSSAVTGIL